ncbi:MAG: NUDIX hydrolase [Microcoleaceae cyanobacterium]
MQPWTLIQSAWAFNHKWCQIRQDRVELPNGTMIDDFFVNVRPDIALVLPITAQQEIVFVRQYRHGIGRILLELPAGAFNPAQENAEQAAGRELAEETGYVTEHWTRLATLYDNPVKDTNSVHLFLAENVRRLQDIQLDLTEDIEVILIPIPEIKSLMARGEICVAGTVAALCLGLGSLVTLD